MRPFLYQDKDEANMAKPRIPKTSKGWYGPFYHGTSVENARKILSSGQLSITNKADREELSEYMKTGGIWGVHYASFYTKDADKAGNIMRQSNWGDIKDPKGTKDRNRSAVIKFFTKVKPVFIGKERDYGGNQTVIFSQLDVPIEIVKIYYFEDITVQSISKFI
jgi:hypothetical protein